MALIVTSKTAWGIVLVNFRFRRSRPSTMTSPRCYAAFACERNKLAVGFPLDIANVESDVSTSVTNPEICGYQPCIAGNTNPDNLCVLALKTTGHNGFRPAKVDELGSGLELLLPARNRVAHAIVNVFALIECDFVMKCSSGILVSHDSSPIDAVGL
uniref:Uncharacterized protein n=1 Tax=biofilter metagenome TaxID=1070537 RepID=A0A193SCX9_9ZZZZ